MKTLTLAVLDLYRFAARPFMPRACRFHPSCGDYAHDCVSRHGVLRGAFLSLLRVARCHPFDPGGHDPVPAGIP